MTEIYTARFVELGDLLTRTQLECWADDDLPWTYGDTFLSLITRQELMGWLEKDLGDLDTENDKQEWKQTLEKVKALPEDVRIGL